MIYNEKETMKKFGDNIKKYRNRLGLTQEKLAELCQTETSYIGQIERAEKCVSIKAIEQICKSLNISVQDLFDFSYNINFSCYQQTSLLVVRQHSFG